MTLCRRSTLCSSYTSLRGVRRKASIYTNEGNRSLIHSTWLTLDAPHSKLDAPHVRLDPRPEALLHDEQRHSCRSVRRTEQLNTQTGVCLFGHAYLLCMTLFVFHLPLIRSDQLYHTNTNSPVLSFFQQPQQTYRHLGY